jgi:hypothetical protein
MLSGANAGLIACNLATVGSRFANLPGFTADDAVPCSIGLPELQDFCGGGDVVR